MGDCFKLIIIQESTFKKRKQAGLLNHKIMKQNQEACPQTTIVLMVEGNLHPAQ